MQQPTQSDFDREVALAFGAVDDAIKKGLIKTSDLARAFPSEQIREKYPAEEK